MSTLSLRKIKHDSSSVDNITLASSGSTTVTNLSVINTTNPTSWVSVDSGLTTQSMYLQANTTSGDTRIGSYTNHPLGLYTNNIERLRIDTSGRVTTPFQPAFFARGRNSTLTAISTYYTPINFSSVDLNRGSHWNNTTGTFTAPVSGDYLTMFTVGNQGAENNGQYIGIYILRNDVSYMSAWSLNTGYDSTAHCGGVIPLSAGDTIKFTYYNTYGTPPTATQFTQVTCYLVG